MTRHPTLPSAPPGHRPIHSSRTLSSALVSSARGNHPLLYLSASLHSLPLFLSFPVQHTLSALQQPFQTADAIFSGSWQSFVGVDPAIATKKRAPRGRSLRPSNWRRCPSTVARVRSPCPFLSCFSPRACFFLAIFCLFLMTRSPRSSRPLCFYYFFLSVFSHSHDRALHIVHWTSKH